MDYYFFVLTIVCIWIMVSLSTNMVIGYAGLFSMGHVAYMGIGAYTAAILNIIYGVNYLVTIPIAILVTALFSFLTYLPLMRLVAFPFGLATLGMNVVVVDIIHIAAPRVPGAEGLFGLKTPEFLANGPLRFVFVLALTVLCVMFAYRIVNSPFGRTLRALRDRPEAAEAAGKDPRWYRTVVWTLSGAIAGLAGALYASTLFYIDPTVFVVAFSFNVLVYIGIGGLASILGSILGPLLLITFSESLRFAGLPSDISGPVQQIIYGLLLIVLMLYRRRGLVGNYEFKD